MSNTKHTPGPWVVTTSMSGARSVSQVADLYSVALIEKWRPEFEANAKLIAAAPELLTHLQKLVSLVGNTEAAANISNGLFDAFCDCLKYLNEKGFGL